MSHTLLVFILVLRGVFSFTVDVYFSGTLLNCVFQHKGLSVIVGNLLKLLSLKGSSRTALVDIFSCSEQTNCGGVETVL